MRLALILILAVTSVYGQQFKKLKVGFGFGVGLDFPKYYDNMSTASIAYLEPSYRINDRFSIGFRLERCATGGIIRFTGGGGSSIGSFGFNGQYYFSDRIFRPLVGLGVGFYHPHLSGGSPYVDGSEQEETSFGFYPRLGFDYGHFTFTIDYNIASSSKAMLYDHISNSSANGKMSNSYGSVKMGVLIGGGRKKSH